MVGTGEQAAIDSLVQRLQQRYSDLARATVKTVVRDTHAKFDGRPIRDFIPLFVERGALQELCELAHA